MTTLLSDAERQELAKRFEDRTNAFAREVEADTPVVEAALDALAKRYAKLQGMRVNMKGISAKLRKSKRLNKRIKGR